MTIIEEIAKKQNVDAIFDEKFWSFAIPLILKLQSDGASFFIKADGERNSDIFTIMIEGGPLGSDYLRCETNKIQNGISQVISEYSQKFWC